ncbi:MAG TPA: hypothetical protein VLN26_12685 [Gaiellaceae bacterium]|nr:hypothetical protein [Gaiellaceae bacterium]
MTLRLDRAGDGASLYQLAPLADPFVPTVQLVPLLELRAGQIRRVDVRPRPRRRLLPRRA